MGFERRMPECAGCQNDFVSWPQAKDSCECPEAPADLDRLFCELNTGDRRRTAAVLNMTDFYMWQAAAVISADYDTGGSDYYLYRASDDAPWRVFFHEADKGWGSDFNCPERTTPPPNGDLRDWEYALDGLAPRLHGPGGGGYCAPDIIEFHHLQQNQWAASGGPAEQMFGMDFKHFLAEWMRMPGLRSCAITESVAALLADPHSPRGVTGVIREVLQEDIALWGQRVPHNNPNPTDDSRSRAVEIDASAEMILIWWSARSQYIADALRDAGAWTPDPIISREQGPASCGTADEAVMADFCPAEHGVCSQGSTGPTCTSGESQGDSCNCKPVRATASWQQLGYLEVRCCN